ncbi:MAG: hypothetical protein CL878_01160 [Dehalococcoidia bacterium]|nr:hypothetical protein [Dehalococcoidia bacterium]
MFSLPGYAIGDAWFAIDDGVAHCFFCTSPPPNADWHWDIGHAASRDLVHWEYVGLALERGPDEAWDSQTLSTGSVLQWNGRFWMAYSALRKNENPPTRKVHRVGLAVSDDLYTWTKDERNPVNERDPKHYERLGPVHKAYSQWRDPFLFTYADRIYQYVCARSKSHDRDRRGTIGLAVSQDMQTWQVKPPLQVDSMATELEVPQVYEIGGHYYLVFCASTQRLLPAFKRRFPGHQFRHANYSMVGDSPLGPFYMHGTGEILPADAPVQPYASRLVWWEDQWVMLGTVAGGNRFICDPIPVVATETGIHSQGTAWGAARGV